LSDANLSKRELCELIKEAVPGFEVMLAEVGEDPDKRNYIVSNRRIEETGYRPCFSLRDGIAELVKGYQIVRRRQFANA
jgi:nucleoside-diphosphate-sugar epimerase